MIYTAVKTTCCIERQVHSQNLPNQTEDRYFRLKQIIRFKQLKSRPSHITGVYTFSKNLEGISKFQAPYRRHVARSMLRTHKYLPVPDRWGS